MSRPFVVVALVVSLAPAGAGAQSSSSPPSTSVGEVHFANSGSPAAQARFLEGLAQLHNFEYPAAADLFRKAQEIDPGFAMAYWGEAMTYTHPVWMEQDREAALKALVRLAPTPDTRVAKARTEREKDYMRAVEVLYGEGDKKARDVAFADAMGALSRKYADDVDAAAFYALSLLGTAHDGRDFAIYMRSAAVLEPLFPANPNHPGLAHYLIHSYDDPVHAPLGLRAARAYSKIAPSAGHAQHMCSHIFVALGMWDDVVAANEAAMRVVNDARAHHGQAPAACGHYPFWLEYGYLQQGRFADAKRMVAACYAVATKALSRTMSSVPNDPDVLAGLFAEMRSRYLIDTEDWSGEVAAWQTPRGHADADHMIDFADGFGAARAGKIDEAKQAFERLRQDRDSLAQLPSQNSYPASAGRIAVLEQQLGAMIDLAQGRAPQAIEALRAAAEKQSRLPFEFGPPFIEKPSYELLGEVLLVANEGQDARAAFEKALARTPERTAALVGLMRAAEKTGDAKKAEEVRAELQKIWRQADHPMSTEARR
jgi:tetratricopeptide (TPR) repeat protein